MTWLHPDGKIRKTGHIPRNWHKCPHGSMVHAPAFALPLIPREEWADRCAQKDKDKSWLSDIRDTGNNGQPIPSLDQDGVGYSHTADTEVLTENGWKPWPEWNGSDLLASINPITGLMEFQAAIERHGYEYKDEIIYSTNRRLDFGVTKNHRMFVRRWDEQLRTLSDTYSFVPAENLGWYAGFMAAPRGFIGTELVKLRIEGDRDYGGDDLLALTSLICSDGYAGGVESTRNKVSFCCFHEGRYPMVAALAHRVGFREQPTRRGVWYRENAGALAAWIRVNCYHSPDLGSWKKKLPDLVKVASMRQIYLFLQFFGDQAHNTESGIRFYSSSKRMIDDLQELHLRIGRRGTICVRPAGRGGISPVGKMIRSNHPEYTLCVAEADRLCIDRKKHIEREPYQGLVYCATVPNGTLITRRNGSVLISGNCWAHSSTHAVMLIRALMGEPYVPLSAFAVASIIKDGRDEGGNGIESLEFIAQNGIPDQAHWPQGERNVRKYDTPEMRENAKLHVCQQWWDLDPRNMEDQMVTCLLCDIPVVFDSDGWSHSICAIKFKLDSRGSIGDTMILNSWSDEWGERGMGWMREQGYSPIPDGAVAPAVMTGSFQ